MKKVLGVILGVLMCVGGFYCLVNPDLTFMSLGTIFAITLIESAIGYFVLWLKIKKNGGKSGILIVNAILSLIGGIGLLTNAFTQILLEGVLLNLIALFMLVGGVTQIIHAFEIKKILPGKAWILELIGGILVVIAGIISIKNPLTLGLAIGIKIAINIFTIGISIISLSLFVKE